MNDFYGDVVLHYKAANVPEVESILQYLEDYYFISSHYKVDEKGYLDIKFSISGSSVEDFTLVVTAMRALDKRAAFIGIERPEEDIDDESAEV